MAWLDLPIDQLREHRSTIVPADDLGDFWAEKLASARSRAQEPVLTPLATPLSRLEVFDLEFSGADGHRVRGWFLRPQGIEGELPCLVQFIGYGGGRSLHHEWTLWPSAGWATLVMDTRGQGWADTPDLGVTGNPQVSGFVTRGITDPGEHFYARVFVDAARAVETARSLPGVDPSRIAVGGGSQGGAITIAAAALSEGLIGALVGVPFWCDVMRAASITDSEPYCELRKYLASRPYDADAVQRTLSYLDGTVLASMATTPALFEIGMMDDVCPPSTCYAAYNAWAGPKEVREYFWNGHEGGDSHHVAVALEWLGQRARP
jgi:cephalosporin-C deacetylase